MHEREANANQEDGVGDEERPAAVLVHEEGEAPHVAEADGPPHGGDDERPPGRPPLALHRQLHGCDTGCDSGFLSSNDAGAGRDVVTRGLGRRHRCDCGLPDFGHLYRYM